MKKFLLFIAVSAAMLLSSCEAAFDYSDVMNKLEDHEQRISALEELCDKMNTNIDALQTIIEALEKRDYVTNVSEVRSNGEIIGYTISFAYSESITIYHGKDGQNGADGKDGKDGYTPQIGVKQDSDNIYYWTIDGEWLLDANGNKIKAVGTDGKDGANGADGQDGKDGQDGANGANGNDGADGKDGQDGQNGQNGADGITPLLKIENDYWYVSYDNGATWQQLGKATGEDGKDGADGANGNDGDSFFQGVDTSNQEYVVLTLADGTQIKLPTWYAFEQLQILCSQMNTNISSLQSIVNALSNNDYVTSVEPITENGLVIGYTIHFAKSTAVTIYHGEDGKDGQNGADGKDGYTPQIGVKQDSDNIYYWTIDGEWLLDANGNKIKAVGTDGKDGQDGTGESVVPEFKIEDDYWYVSYDNGATWQQLGKATSGTGDSIFRSVTEDESKVYFTLNDGSVITVYKDPVFDIIFDTTNLQDVKVNSDVKVNYEISGSAESVTIEVLPTNDLRAVLCPDDESNKRGYILIRTGSTFDAASRVVVIASDGNKAIMKSLVLNVKPEEESAQLYVYNGATKTVSAKGGTVTVSFITNVDCEAVIPAEYQGWISVAETRALECKHITLSIAENTGDRRNGEVNVQTTDGKLSITYTISQVGASSTSNPEVGDDGAITGSPAPNEIFYTTSNGLPIEPSATAFNGVVVSNTYANGVGIIVLDRPFTIIMDYAFDDKTTLTNIVLPNTITSIGKEAFYYCSSLKSVTIPDSVTSIGQDAFRGCSSLKSVTIGNSVTSIGFDAFAYCGSLTSVYITDLSAWCKIAFDGSDSNPCYYGAKLYLNGSELTEVTIPSDITEIKKYAFYKCSSLTSVTIPDSVTSIGIVAFAYCSSLTSVTIGNSVTSIGNQAFYNCSSLTSVTIGNSVTSIGGSAFRNCRSLTSVTIGNSVTKIGDSAFEGCSSLTSISLPDATKTIGEEAFFNCATLTKVEMGSGLTRIDADAFWGCYLLKEIYCKAATPPTGHKNMFVCADLEAKIYVPTASVSAYKAKEYWSDYSSYIVGYEF